MKTSTCMIAATVLALAAQGGRYNITPSRSPDRVRSPLKVDLARIGTLAPRSANEDRKSVV